MFQFCSIINYWLIVDCVLSNIRRKSWAKLIKWEGMKIDEPEELEAMKQCAAAELRKVIQERVKLPDDQVGGHCRDCWARAYDILLAGLGTLVPIGGAYLI